MWLLVAAALLAGPGEDTRMIPCTGIPVPPGAGTLASAVAEAPAGATLCLAEGDYEALIEVTRSLTVVGVPGRTVLRGSGRGAILAVQEDGLALRVEGVVFAGGVARAGGALALGGASRVVLAGCTFRGNRAGQYGGGALYASHGELEVTDGRFEDNEGPQGGAVLLDGVVRARFTGGEFTGNRAEQGGAVRAREGAEATFRGVAFHGNRGAGADGALRFGGSSSRQPRVVLEGCTLADPVAADVPYGGQVRVKDCTVPKGTLAGAGVVDAGGNTEK